MATVEEELEEDFSATITEMVSEMPNMNGWVDFKSKPVDLPVLESIGELDFTDLEESKNKSMELDSAESLLDTASSRPLIKIVYKDFQERPIRLAKRLSAAD
jgi:hypothetical protein